MLKDDLTIELDITYHSPESYHSPFYRVNIKLKLDEEVITEVETMECL